MTDNTKNEVHCYHHFDHNENKFKQYWRPVAAVVYMVICLFDFVIMPSIYEYHNYKQNYSEIIDLTLKYPSDTAQIKALETINRDGQWEPLTLMGGGMFHVAFGAIIGAAAFTRGQEKTERIKNSQNGFDPSKGM
ncbi:MAG: hypothetical protein WC284_16980 [Candidimonas sp.]